MLRTMMKSKIHRATVTQADLHYVGSVTVDEDLLDAADLLPGEQVPIVDVNNGARLETYVIAGERGSGVIGINGAAAHLVHPGDLVILIAYGQMDDAEARDYQPRVVFVDADNRPSTWAATRRTPPSVGGHAARPRVDRSRGEPCCSRSTSATPTPSSGCSPGSGEHAKVVQHWRIRTEPEVTADELALTIDGPDRRRLRAAHRCGRAVHGAVGAARGAGDARPVLAVGAARADRTRCAHRHSAAGRQPEGGRRRPDRQLPGAHSTSYGAAAHRRRLRLVDLRRRRVGQGRVPRRRDRARRGGLVGCRGRPLGGAAPVELTRPRSVIGKNTVECMQAGAVFGFAGLVDGLVGADPRGRRRLRAATTSRSSPPGTPRRCCCPSCTPSSTTTST